MSEPAEATEKDPVPGAGNRFVFLVVGATVVFALLSMLLEQIGIPVALITLMAALLIIGGAVLPGMLARTALLSEWQFARRAAGPITIGMANAAVLLPGSVFLFLPGWFFSDDPKAPTMLVALLAAAFLSGVGIHPMLRGWAAGSPLDIAAARFDSVWIKLPLAAVLTLACILLLWAELTVIGRVAAPILGTGNGVTIMVAAILVGFAVIPGGLLSVLRTSALAYVFLTTAFLGALVWISVSMSGFPVPQIVFGAAALTDVVELERQLTAIGIPALGEVLSDNLFQPASILAGLVLMLFVAAGLAVLPAAIGTQQSARSTGASRKSVVWTLMLLALVVSAVPAASVYTKLSVYNSTLGLTSGEVGQTAPWIAYWGEAANQRGVAFVELCGAAISTSDNAIQACGGNPDHSITPGDLAIRPEFVAIGLAQAANLPFVFLLLSAMAVIAAALATANATLFAGASLFASLFAGLGIKGAAQSVQPQMRRLFASRLGGLVLLAAAAILAANSQAHPFETFLWAMAVLVALFLPLLLTGLWSDMFSANSAASGLIAGAAVLLLVVGSGAELKIPALAGLPASIVAGLAALSVNLAVIAIVQAIRRGRQQSGDGYEEYRLPDLANRRIQEKHGLVE